MAVTAPSQDTAGIALQARVTAVQTLVTANANPLVLYQNQQLRNQLQVELVDHFMVTGWLNAAAILETYSAPAWDSVGQALTDRVAFLQNLYDNVPAAPAGNAEGYGSAGWVTVAQNYRQQLYAAQIALVERIMDIGGGTSAATMLSSLTGSQTDPAGIAYQYVFDSVGYTDAWIDD